MSDLTNADKNIIICKPLSSLRDKDIRLLNDSHIKMTTLYQERNDPLTIYFESEKKRFHCPVHLDQADDHELSLAIQTLNDPTVKQSFDEELDDLKKTAKQQQHAANGSLFVSAPLIIGTGALAYRTAQEAKIQSDPSGQNNSTLSVSVTALFALASIAMVYSGLKLKQKFRQTIDTIGGMEERTLEKRDTLKTYAAKRRDNVLL